MNNNGVYNGTGVERDSIKKLLGQLVAQIGTIVRGEIALASQSLKETISDIRNGLILFAAAAVLGFTALLSLFAAIIIKLAEIMSLSGAATVVGTILIVISLLLAFFGYRKIKSSVE